MPTNQETTVKISKWLVKEVDTFINTSNKNKSEFPSKRNFVDRAVITFLEDKGIDLNKSNKKGG